MVLQLHEGGRAHDAAGHDAAGEAHIGEIALFGIVARCDFRGGGVHRVQGGRIWIDAQFAEFRKGFPAAAFLFVEVVGICHVKSDFSFYRCKVKKNLFYIGESRFFLAKF